MLHAAQTAEPAVDHDGHPGAKSFTLLHTITRHIRKIFIRGELEKKEKKRKNVQVNKHMDRKGLSNL